ncbi:microtubule-associated serine/threonine-protein kinase 3-like [Dermacentor andersoni]|uniref:microtubule-associated serine/threonine-protein kinase 3-like n=1 Tax=Dermacentor andersoni TaxID=34620 RepID=UPI003B3A98DC
MLVTLFPRVPKTATVLLEFFIKRESKVSLMRDPLSHFCQEEVVLHAQECMLKLNKQVITYQDLRDMVENLVGLHSLCIKKDPEVAKALGVTVRKLIIITGEVASSLEKIAEVSVTDWMAIGDAIITKIERMQLTKPQPFSSFIPKIRDFHSIKMLGAGGFGAVYLANYRPANFVATVKLVNVDRFSRHKQAAMDKVVASVIRNPFLVKYYSCFCVKEAYVTIMEYIAGLDLMRVVTKEEYLDIECSQIIMAQLILALEHMHLRGFLHRDIKVSNMLILPGGRVKVIDFDTTKVCSGHFSKRLLRGYFRRTPFEFHDGESAGTIPYMAPEILKRRPYGESAMDRPTPAQRPTKAQCFLFNVPVSTPVDAIIDSIEEVIGAGGLQYLQHHGANKFLAAVRSAAQAAKMAAKGSLLLANKVVPLERMGTSVVYVTVYRLPPCVSDDALIAALAPYGKCRGISDVVFEERADISNASRLVKLDMVKPPPNFIMVTGFRVMLEYKGMKRVCSKCGAEGRAADWWSAGIVLYKLTTGRVPFRGKTKQALRERIITSPLKFPRTEDHPHSATAPAKDMMYRMLKKNPVERLGSRNYSDLKTHPFFEQFDWQMLYNRTNLCEISSIAEILKADAEKGNEPDPDDQRRHLTIDEMTDIAFDTQRPLLCYASGSFKKLMNTVRESKTAINISPTFMDTSGFSTTPVDYRAATPGQSSIKTGLASTANEKKEGPSSSIGKVELILFRKKKYWKYWSFGFSMRRVKGEDDNFYLYVDGVKKDSPADRSQVLPLDVILSVNGTHVEDVAQARKALSACSDQLVLSVMSSSTYRVLTSRRDMMSLIRCLPKETAVLKSMPFSCITGMPYGLGVIDVSVWDDKAKRFTTVFVLTHTDVTPVGSDTVYPGDVLAQIDGVNLEGLMRDQVMQMLNTTSGDVTVSVVPMSPMRVRRILVSKLHETVMTDTNVASRTTGADIESL